MTRIRMVAVSLTLLVVLSVTVGRVAAQANDTPAEPKTGTGDRKPLKADPKDDELRKLQIDRYNETLSELASLTQLVLRGSKSPEVLFDAQKRFVKSGLEVFDKPEDRISLLTDQVAMAKDAEKVIRAQVQAGIVPQTDAHLATYNRIDAEIQLLKAKRAAEKPKDK